MRLKAMAKINWTLDITGVREDGYHLLDMLMQSVTLWDEVTLLPSDSLRLTCEGNSGIPADERNIAFRAAAALRERAGVRDGAEIRLVKRIPSGAGLGGGSADAAAVLTGLHALWGLRLPQEELERIALGIGADVPFCLRGGLQRVRGIGEQLTALGEVPPMQLVIVQPCDGLSTRAVYEAWHAQSAPETVRAAEVLDALRTGRPECLPAAPGNALERVSRQMQPEIGRAIDALRAKGACCAQMSGSGSAVFGVFADAPAADRAAETLRTLWPKTYRCETCGGGVVRAKEEETCRFS